MNKEFGTTICVSDSVCEAVGPGILVRPLRTVQVKGRKHRFMIYQLLGFNDSDDPEIAVRGEDAKLAAMTRDASASFERGDFAEAGRRYRKILDAFPNDPVAKSLLAACAKRCRPSMRDPPAGARPLVLRNGKIITINARFEIAQAIAVSGGRIDAVGSDADIAPLIDATAQVIDLNGRAVIPGLIDAHAHMDREGLKEALPSMAGVRSIDDVLQRIDALVRERNLAIGSSPCRLGSRPSLKGCRSCCANAVSRPGLISIALRLTTRSLSSRAGGTGASPSRSLGSPTVARLPLPVSAPIRSRLPLRS
jgi:Predicted metal-dependent hydrolase with the TIM-barrel fold